MKYKKYEKILEGITQIPFSVFYDKYCEVQSGDYNREQTFLKWVMATEFEREKSMQIICALPNLKGMTPDVFLQIICS